ncbi:hypothetical protein ACLGIH_34860 [Streptomyces sp. HMX87]|uniref:hypothetical protein n=1 Tax=Streptomyces sp. HMX87 TaxID=3390849 RepID=UPI003A85B8E3
MTTERSAAQWDLELDDLFVTIGHRFGRVELRRRSGTAVILVNAGCDVHRISAQPPRPSSPSEIGKGSV